VRIKSSEFQVGDIVLAPGPGFLGIVEGEPMEIFKVASYYVLARPLFIHTEYSKTGYVFYNQPKLICRPSHADAAR
jgi:hypothetical protein